VTYDNGRTTGVVDDCAAHGAEEQRAKSAAAAAPDDDQIGSLGCFDDRLGGIALDEPAVNLRSPTGVGSLDGTIQYAGGVDLHDIAHGGGR
jgi:hypothetical protein